jgi:hypothetical protein
MRKILQVRQKHPLLDACFVGGFGVNDSDDIGSDELRLLVSLCDKFEQQRRSIFPCSFWIHFRERPYGGGADLGVGIVLRMIYT